MLVVNRHTLIAVDALDFFDQIQLGLTNPLDLHEFLGIERAIGDRFTGAHFLAVTHNRPSTERQHNLMALTLIVGNRYRDALAVLFFEAEHA